MKNGNIGDFGVPTEAELSKINEFTRRKFAADELYAFSVVLCDNDIDRDFERFTDESLEKLAELYVGKTGIFDHSHKAENQCARIFACEVQAVEGKKNRIGEPYKQLFARAYMPKSAASEELILSIESGIKKEVSVGCSMSEGYCSICGQPVGTCQHKKGRSYRKNGQKSICYFNLCSPVDAYEWSFVAVPAQPKAGVVKSFADTDTFAFGSTVKSAQNGEVILTVEEAREITKQLEHFESLAAAAGEFLNGKKAGIAKMFLQDAPDTAIDMFMKALDRLSPEELFKLYNEGEAATEKATSQLMRKRKATPETRKNSFFII